MLYEESPSLRRRRLPFDRLTEVSPATLVTERKREGYHKRGGVRGIHINERESANMQAAEMLLVLDLRQSHTCWEERKLERDPSTRSAQASTARTA